MSRSDITWGSLVLAGVALEAYALRDGVEGATLSEATCRAFRVRTRVGKVVFATAWTSFAAWYLVHILNFEEHS